jgi:hypothetical protein
MEVDAVRAVSGTTSPSVLIYAGLDGRRRKMALRRRPAEPRRKRGGAGDTAAPGITAVVPGERLNVLVRRYALPLLAGVAARTNLPDAAKGHRGRARGLRKSHAAHVWITLSWAPSVSAEAAAYPRHSKDATLCYVASDDTSIPATAPQSPVPR